MDRLQRDLEADPEFKGAVDVGDCLDPNTDAGILRTLAMGGRVLAGSLGDFNHIGTGRRAFNSRGKLKTK